MSENPEEEHTPEPEESYDDPERLGPLGEPESEPAPQGIYILLAFFLIALVVMWALVYFQLWARW